VTVATDDLERCSTARRRASRWTARIDKTDDGYNLEAGENRWPGLDEAALGRALESSDEYVTNWRYWRETVGGEGPRDAPSSDGANERRSRTPRTQRMRKPRSTRPRRPRTV